MIPVADNIKGYDHGSSEVAASPVSLEELELLKMTVGFTSEDARYLKLAAGVLRDQARAIVLQWRSQIIAHIPHLARHSWRSRVRA